MAAAVRLLRGGPALRQLASAGTCAAMSTAVLTKAQEELRDRHLAADDDELRRDLACAHCASASRDRPPVAASAAAETATRVCTYCAGVS